MIYLWLKLKLLWWIYSGDNEEYTRVTLPTGEVFYVRVKHVHRLHWEDQYFYNGHTGTLSEMLQHAPIPVYVQMIEHRII